MNVSPEHRGEWGYGDIWTWVALCADTKLSISWLVGPRDLRRAEQFMCDVASRVINRVQVSTDGLISYTEAVERAFGSEVDYAMLLKQYDRPSRGPYRRYSQPRCIGTYSRSIAGNPNRDKVSTSFVERQNLHMRMSMRRFTRLTNAFSKKAENHAHAVALHFSYYNLCRIHQSLRITPAMAAGITDRVWEIDDLLSLLSLDFSPVKDKSKELVLSN